MARDHQRHRRDRRCELKKTGNASSGGGRRPGHPPGQPARRRVPPRTDRGETSALAEQLRRALDGAVDTVRTGRRPWISPTWNSNTICLALHDPAATRSRAAASVRRAGWSCTASEFREHVIEQQVAALHGAARHAGRPPLPHRPARARYSLNCAVPVADRPRTQRAARARRRLPQPVPQHPGTRRRDHLRRRRGAAPDRPTTSGPTAPPSRCRREAGTGHGVSEAPRGLLYHRYELDADGLINVRDDRPAHLAEPASHRGRPAPRRLGQPATTTTRR